MNKEEKQVIRDLWKAGQRKEAKALLLVLASRMSKEDVDQHRANLEDALGNIGSHLRVDPDSATATFFVPMIGHAYSMYMSNLMNEIGSEYPLKSKKSINNGNLVTLSISIPKVT